jgi:DNA polymerase-3 subunit delta'
MFSQAIGQKRIKKILESGIRKNRLSHAYLFYGPDGSGMEAMVADMAATLLCGEKHPGGCGECPACRRFQQLEHPAFRLVFPVPPKPKGMPTEKYQEIVRERGLQWIREPYREISFLPEISGIPVIGIDEIRTLKKEVTLRLAEDTDRILVIASADRMTPAAANSLLKLLEEPPDRTILFLTTAAQGRLLPTILSRCQHIRFSPLSADEIEEALVNRWNLPTPRARFLSRMAGGNLTRALSLNQDEFEKQREAAFAFLEKSLDSDPLRRLEADDALLGDWDKAGAQTIFRLLRVFLRDWLHIQSGNPDLLINLDYAEKLSELSKKYPAFRIQEGIERAGSAIDFIEKNVYLELVVHCLSQDLNHCNIR